MQKNQINIFDQYTLKDDKPNKPKATPIERSIYIIYFSELCAFAKFSWIVTQRKDKILLQYIGGTKVLCVANGGVGNALILPQ